MNTLIARHLERQAAAKKRETAEKKHHQLTYRGVAYCKPCPPCNITVAYY